MWRVLVPARGLVRRSCNSALMTTASTIATATPTTTARRRRSGGDIAPTLRKGRLGPSGSGRRLSEVDGEAALAIEVRGRPRETARLQQAADVRQIVLDARLGVDRLARPKVDDDSERLDRDTLVVQALEVHLDPRQRLVPASDVAEARRIEASAQLAVDARQDVLVERGGDASGVVVGG